jgi:DNA-binding LytR/AlgR family response regulator
MKNNLNPDLLWFNHRKKSIKPEDVVYLKSCDNYTKFYLKSGKNFLASLTMKSYERQLSDKGNFSRINRGILVNLNYITGFEKTEEGNVACLSTGEKIGVSRRKMRNIELN